MPIRVVNLGEFHNIDTKLLPNKQLIFIELYIYLYTKSNFFETCVNRLEYLEFMDDTN